MQFPFKRTHSRACFILLLFEVTQEKQGQLILLGSVQLAACAFIITFCALHTVAVVYIRMHILF